MNNKTKPKWRPFGNLLKKERQKNNLTRSELGQKIGKKTSTIVSWEQGYRRPKQKALLNLSSILGTPIQELQSSAEYTPEFDWYSSLTAKPDTEGDILLTATDEEKDYLRVYLHYLRFERQVKASPIGIRSK